MCYIYSIRAAVWSIFNQPNENVAFSNIKQESFGTRSIEPFVAKKKNMRPMVPTILKISASVFVKCKWC
jgi:hypothetical protein